MVQEVEREMIPFHFLHRLREVKMGEETLYRATNVHVVVGSDDRMRNWPVNQLLNREYRWNSLDWLSSWERGMFLSRENILGVVADVCDHRRGHITNTLAHLPNKALQRLEKHYETRY